MISTEPVKITNYCLLSLPGQAKYNQSSFITIAIHFSSESRASSTVSALPKIEHRLLLSADRQTQIHTQREFKFEFGRNKRIMRDNVN